MSAKRYEMRATEDLAAHAMRLVPHPGVTRTSIERLSLIRCDEPTEPMPTVYEASLCLILQGSKQVSLGEHTRVYDASRCLIVSFDLPLVGHVTEATPEHPYLCCKLDIDRSVLAELVGAGQPSAPARPVAAATDPVTPWAVCPASPDLIDAVARLVRLLDHPADVAVLAPLVEREISYRLLSGAHGPMLRRILVTDSPPERVSRAMAWIRDHHREPLRMQDVAREAGMSLSSLYSHFKTVTTLTPLAYQKQLRLQEARRLMLVEGQSVGTASFAVGYQSPSQFSREYRHLFGTAPSLDMDQLRQTRREHRKGTSVHPTRS